MRIIDKELNHQLIFKIYWDYSDFSRKFTIAKMIKCENAEMKTCNIDKIIF